MNKPIIELESRAASIDTVSVTIKTLHVNKKQMTLAVFRQLPSKHAPARRAAA